MQLAHSHHQPQLFQFAQLGHWVHAHHAPVVNMFLFYVLPLSMVAPLMFYYAGIHHNIAVLSNLHPNQLAIIGMVFFIAELVMTFVLAGFIEWLSNATSKIVHTQYEMLNYPTPKVTSEGIEHKHHKVDFRDAYTLAAVAPTPLWLVSLVLFVPNFAMVVAFGVIALALSMYILYSAAPSILKIEGQGESALIGWVLINTGMIGWTAMMYLTLVTWGYMASGAYM